MFNSSSRICRSFSIKLLSSWPVHGMCWCMGLFLPRCRTPHFLLDSVRFLLVHFSRLLRSLQMVSQPSGLSATPRSFVSSGYTSAPPPRSWIKMSNSTGTSIGPEVTHHTPVFVWYTAPTRLLISDHHTQPCHSARFQSISLCPHPGHTSTESLSGFYTRQCWKPHWD